MPVEFKVGRIQGELPENGSFQTTTKEGDKKLITSVELREAMKRQNKEIRKGEIHSDNIIERSEIREIAEEEKYAIQIDDFHNLTITNNDLVEAGYSIEKRDYTKVISSNFYIFNDLIVYNTRSKGNTLALINECTDIDIESLTVNAKTIGSLFDNARQATWKNIDETTETATIYGDIEESDIVKRTDDSGNLIWIVGEITHSNETHKVGISEVNNSIVVYGKTAGIQAAEIAVHIMTSQ